MPMGSNRRCWKAARWSKAQDCGSALPTPWRKREPPRDAIAIAFHEVSKESYALGGVLRVDKKKYSLGVQPACGIRLS